MPHLSFQALDIPNEHAFGDLCLCMRLLFHAAEKGARNGNGVSSLLVERERSDSVFSKLKKVDFIGSFLVLVGTGAIIVRASTLDQSRTNLY